MDIMQRKPGRKAYGSYRQTADIRHSSALLCRLVSSVLPRRQSASHCAAAVVTQQWMSSDGENFSEIAASAASAGGSLCSR